MEAWLLVVVLSRRGETAPVRMPMETYEECVAAGHEAETLAAKLKDVNVTWSCQSED